MTDIQGRFTPCELGQLNGLLGLLEECLTIEDSLDESHALGYHQEEDDLTTGLRRTALDALVYRAKYGSDNQARSQLVDLFGRFVSRHPRYGSASAVAAVPPHSASGSRLSRHLAQGLAAALGMRPVPIRRARETLQQKAITLEDRLAAVKQRVRNQKDSMAVPMALDGESVIVVDELYGSGASMEEAARSLRQAGSGCVLGLAASKQRLFGAVSLRRRGW
jgi:predicted amidophosphoribosyltransferase